MPGHGKCGPEGLHKGSPGVNLLSSPDRSDNRWCAFALCRKEVAAVLHCRELHSSLGAIDPLTVSTNSFKSKCPEWAIACSSQVFECASVR
eukprot:1742201-Amphidinium_carterae.1